MNKKVDLSFFQDGDTVIIGLSGGADSVALTHMLHTQNSVDIKIIACHLNHNLRGNESLRDLNFVKNLCKKWQIELVAKSVNLEEIAKIKSKGLEECGRECRYALFDELKNKYGAKYIATAHTLSDNIETVIFNMTRGSGLKGICGIPKNRDDIVRPVLNFTTNEIREYCKINNLEYVTDSSNLTLDYTRNKIRHSIIPKLKEINENLEGNFSRLICNLQEDMTFLEKIADDEYKKRKINKDKIYIDSFCDIDTCIKKRIIINFLKDNNLQVNEKYILNILSIIDTGGKFNIAKNLFIICDKNVLSIEKTVKKTLKTINMPLTDGDFKSNTDEIYKIQNLEINNFQTFNKIYKNVFDIWIDCGKIIGSITIRERLPKDEIKLSEKSKTKTLKNIFQEKNIDKQRRKELFVLADEEGVIAIEDIGVSYRVKCDDDTKKAIRITKVLK